jgi:hypothetical protein
MKNLFTIIALCLATIAAFAQGNRGLLKIRDMEGRRIMVTIDGRRFPENARVLTIRNILPGMHKLKIYKFKGNGNWGRAELIYNGNLMVRPSYIYRCTVDDYEGMDVQEYCCLNNNGNYNYSNNNNNGFDMNDHDWEDNYWGNTDNGWHNDGHQGGSHNNNNSNWGNGNNSSNGNNNNGNWGNGNNGNNNGNWGNGGNNNGNWGNNNNNNWGSPNQCMGNPSFAAFKQTVANNNFDSGKMSIVKAQINKAWISAAQLRELVDLFQFESSKLDMAKFGASRVVDKANLFTIYDAFTFESSKTEFAKFIESLQ